MGVASMETWRRMARKAHMEHLQAWRVNGDPRFWVVSSKSESQTVYEVNAMDDTLHCSCRGSEFYPYCKHRALVLESLGALADDPDMGTHHAPLAAAA